MYTMPCIPWTRDVPVELIGDLPAARVNRIARAFVHTGIDYAGPIAVRTTPGRGYKSQKAYIALFVCLTIKALCLELVNCTSPTFIAAYQRFVSRRGLPTMYSDNGTTFHGADYELYNMRKQFAIQTSETVLLQTELRGISYLPASPHFGSL